MSRLLAVTLAAAVLASADASACVPEGETLPVAAPEGYFSWDDDKMFDWFIAAYRDYCQVDSLEGQGRQVMRVEALWISRESRIAIDASKKRVSKMTEELLGRAKRESE